MTVSNANVLCSNWLKWWDFLFQQLYHWHHTSVNTIAFTESGSNFYSGGLESVLVRWHPQKPDSRDFLPRMFSIPVHVVVAAGNQKIAVSGNDNGKTENLSTVSRVLLSNVYVIFHRHYDSKYTIQTDHNNSKFHLGARRSKQIRKISNWLNC